MNQNVPLNEGKVIPSPSLSSSKTEIKTHIPPRSSKAAAQVTITWLGLAFLVFV